MSNRNSNRDRGGGRGSQRGGRGGSDLPFHPRGGSRGAGGDSRGGHTGGRGGRGGRGGEASVFISPTGATPPINAKVQDLETKLEVSLKAAAPKGAKSQGLDAQRPLRPGFGTLGRPILLWANYFELVVPESLALLRYNVSIAEDNKGNKPTGKKLRRVIELLIEDKFADLRSSITTDYKSTLVCKAVLPLSGGDEIYAIVYRSEGEDEPPTKSDTFQVRVRDTGTLAMADLLNYISSSSVSAMYESKEEMIHALNIIMGSHVKADPSMFSVGSSKHFKLKPSQQDSVSLGAGLNVIRGLFMSVRTATARLLVNVQVKHAACYEEGPLSQVINNFIRNGGNYGRLEGFLKKLRVQVTHIVRKNRRGEEIPRIKTITGLAKDDQGLNLPNPPRVSKFGAGPKDVKFYMANDAVTPGSSSKGSMKGSKPSLAAGQGRYISVHDFFQQTYRIACKDPNMPVVNVGSRDMPSYLPADVCTVLPGQPSGSKLSPTQTQNMIKFSVRKPAQNAAHIATNGTGILQNDFDIAVQPSLITVPGRVLNFPQVKYLDEKPAAPRFGNWNMQNIQFSAKTKISSWTYLWISSEGQGRDTWADDADLMRTLREFHAKLAEVGVSGPRPLDGLRVTPTAEQNFQEIDETVNKFVSSAKRAPPQLVLVILPNDNSVIYSKVKYALDIKYGIRNVCVVASKFAKEDNHQYFANVGLKINLKLGGRNQHLDKPKLGIISEGKTMVVGLDVTHPSPGSLSTAPSVVGIVASVDHWLGQWPADIRIQDGRQEMVSGLEDLLISRLRLWRTHNQNALPENILIYRDGVSEGQYNLVLEKELPLLRQACESLYPAPDTAKGLPRMSIVVCGKRHNTRFYPVHLDDADRSSNTPNGTVVDRGVTEARNWDFFLQAHTAIQGTARPAHYYIVLDEIFRNRQVPTQFRNAADVLEDLTHNMCYLFGRATKAVSICPPAYYADLVCTRARCYLSRFFDATSAPTVTEGAVGGDKKAPTANAKDVLIHENVKDTMFYI